MNKIQFLGKSSIQVYDLRSKIPSGLEVHSLSLPIFDGRNYFRKPEGNIVSIELSNSDTSREEYFGIRFQIYSPISKVKYIIKANDQVVYMGISSRNKLPEIQEVGIFSQSKKNVFSIYYECDERDCLRYINQYWTQIIRSPAPKYENTVAVGLKIQRWYLDTPENKIQSGGLSGQSFDGKDYYRNIEKGGFYLKIPPNYRAINTSFAIYGQDKFTIRVMVDSKVVKIASGSREKGILVTVPLYNYGMVQKVIVKVECSGSIDSCARLYSTQLSLSENETVPKLIPILTCCIVLIPLIWLLIFEKGDNEKV